MQSARAVSHAPLANSDISGPDLAAAGLKAFFRITDAWQLKDDDRRVLLGSPSRTTYYDWKKGKHGTLSRDTLDRLSYMLGIHKALGILFNVTNQLNWLSHGNTDAPFNGQSPIDHMLGGSLIALADVRRYLDAARG